MVLQLPEIGLNTQRAGKPREGFEIRRAFRHDEAMEFFRWIAAAILIAFFAYTIYASRTENFRTSFMKVLSLKWGRQVTADLYIGLLLFTFIIYLNEADALITTAWLIPTLILGNIVPLIYFVINFQSLIAHFQ